MGSLDEEGRQAVLREFVSVRVPLADVSRFVAETNRNQIPNLDHHIAESESADMSEGVPRTVGSVDQHMVHILEHAQFLSAKLQGVMQGQEDAVSVSQAAQLFLQHLSGHMQYLSQDVTRKGDLQQAEQIIKQLMEKVGPIQQQAEEIQKQQQKQMEEQQAKLAEAEEIIKNKDAEIEKYKIDKMSEVEMYKADQLDKSRRMKTQTSAQAMITKLQAQMEANQQKLQSDMQLDAARTRSEIETKLQKALADIQVRLSKAGGKSGE
jgi:BMFP domain-containing protein YqiC